MAARESRSRQRLEGPRPPHSDLFVGLAWTIAFVAALTQLTATAAAQARLLGSPTREATATPGEDDTPGNSRVEATQTGTRGAVSAGANTGETLSSSETASRGISEAEVPPPPDSVVDGPPGDGSFAYPGTRRGPRLLDESGLRISSGVATRLRALDSDFQVLAARGGGSIVDGIISILTGGLSITVAILLNDFDHPMGGIGMSPYLLVYGGAGVARGILHFVLMTNPSEAAVTYTHMPMTTDDEVRARLEYGERELAGLAERSQIARILDGSINIAAGLAILPIYLGPNDFEAPQIFDWFVLIAAGISVVTGVITLVTTSDAERKWSAYSELRDRLQANEATRLSDASESDREDASASPSSADASEESDSDSIALQPVMGGSPRDGLIWIGGVLRF